MKLGSLPRGLAVAALAAVTVLPLAASPAGAAPAAPTAYTIFGRAEPLVWGGSSSAPVGALHVPFVWGKTNNLAIAKADVKLSDPDENVKPLSGETVHGLTCSGYDEKFCRDPFTPTALAEHQGIDARHAEQAASFGGKDGKFPGRIQALTDCGGKCGEQLVRSLGDAVGPAGGLAGYVSVGSSSASHDLSIDDRGRLVSIARSKLTNVSIGPDNEVRFSSLETVAHGWGTGAPDTKDGKAELRITDFFILGNPVELTGAGLKLANAGPSEQEAYDGAAVLLKKLRERGIRLELPDFKAQLTRTPEHVAVNVRGLTVWFERSVGSVAANAISYPLDLGHSTAVVAALDVNRHVDVNEGENGDVVVQTTAPSNAPAANSGPSGPSSGIPTAAQPRDKAGTGTTGRGSGIAGGGNKTPTTAPGSVTAPTPTPTVGDQAPATPVDSGVADEVTGDPSLPTNLDETALPSPGEIADSLGLRGAHSVSRAFGAFLGLGLILPLARFVIRRLG
jgi:hypothetical protein